MIDGRNVIYVNHGFHHSHASHHSHPPFDCSYQPPDIRQHFRALGVQRGGVVGVGEKLVLDDDASMTVMKVAARAT